MTNIKTYICLLIATFFFWQAGQSQSWKKNHHYWQLKAGVGLLPTFAKDQTKSEVPPLSLELRYRFNKKFSLGLLVGQSVSEATRTHHTGIVESFHHNYKMFAFRASVNTHRWEKWQAYGGIFLAYQQSVIERKSDEKYTSKDTLTHYTPKSNNFLYSGFLGMTFFPDPQLAIFGELSYGLSIATIGIGYSW